MKTRAAPLAVSLICLLGTAPVSAGDPPPAEAQAPGAPENRETENKETENKETENKETEAKEPRTIEVRVIGQGLSDLAKVPGSGALVTAKDVARTVPLDVAELLRRVPGLTVRQEQGAGLRLDISVRGMDSTRSRRVLVLEDGVPVAINPYGEPDLYYAPPVERMRGIEVVKGSGSILFGPQTIGGVVGFVTHAPPDHRSVFLAIDGGQRGYFEILGRYGDAFGDGRYVAQVFAKRGDGVRGEDFFATDAFAKAMWPVSAAGDLTLKVGFHDEEANSTDVGLTREMFERDPRRPTVAPYDRVHVTRVDGSGVLRLFLGENTDLRTLVYVTSTGRIWRRQDYERSPADGIAYERIAGDTTVPGGALYFRDTNTIRDRSYFVFGIEPKLTHRFETAGAAHTLDVGARFLSETSRRAQRAGEHPLSYSGDLVTDESNGTLAISGYVQDRIAFTDWLLVTPGFRLELSSSSRTIGRAIVNGSPADVTIEGSSGDLGLIPGMGLVLGSPALHAFGGLHVGYSPPRLTTAISATGIDERLAPERALHYEAGARVAIGRAFRAEATGFLSNFENQIVPSTRTDSGTTDLVNGGRTRHAGVEAQVSVAIGKALDWPLDVDVTANYTLSDAVFVGGPADGNLLPYAPLHTANAVLAVDTRFGLGFQASYAFVGEMFADEGNTREVDPTGRIGLLPARHVLDLAARYTHKGTGLGAVVSVKNLLDDIYVVSRRPDGTFPAGFRQITAGVRWSYGD